MGDVVTDLWHEVQAGKALSEALHMHSRVFPVFYQNMVKSGEYSGVLPLVMERLASFLEDEHELKGFLLSSMLYPAMVSLVSLGAFGVIIFYVLPRFEKVFTMMRQEVPLITRLVLGFSGFLLKWWWLIVALIAGSVISFFVYLKSPGGKEKVDKWYLKIPLFGELYLKVQTARMARTFSTMLSGGVPILKALTILQESLSNTVLARAISEVRTSLREGGSIARELRKQAVFPPVAVHMIDIGEESSNLEGMLEKLARLYDAEVKNTVKGLLSILEPAVILTLALGIFVMLIAILIPMMRLNSVM